MMTVIIEEMFDYCNKDIDDLLPSEELDLDEEEI